MSLVLNDVAKFISSKIEVSEINVSNYISTENMLPNKGGITTASSLPDTKSVREYIPKDILINNIRPYFKKIWYSDMEGGCSNDIYVLRSNENYDSKFLYYVLSSDDFFSYVMANAKGTKMPRGDKKAIQNYKVPNFSIDKQKKISSFLGEIDRKIEINKKLNKNLEESIKNIFKHYFIDFIPFKDKGYPEGWLSLNLGDVVSDANTGADAIKKAPIVDYDTGIKCVRVGDMTNSRRIDEWGFANVNEENFDKYQLKKEDIIVTRTATLGLNYFITEDLDAVYNNGLIRIKINKNKALPLFIYYYLNTSDYNHYIDCIEGESSTRPNMKINYLLKYPIICPPLKIQKEFIDLIDSLFWMKENIFYQIVELTRLRDTLLPKLMSGEIDVSKINCDLKIIIRKIYIKSSKLFLWRYLSENQNYIKNTKSNETLLKSRTIHKINKFLAKFNARYRYYRQ